MSDEPIKVITQKEQDDADFAIAIATLVFIGLSAAIGWKLSGKTDLGMYIGGGLAFVGCLFNKHTREALIITSIGIVGLSGLLALLIWLIR